MLPSSLLRNGLLAGILASPLFAGPISVAELNYNPATDGDEEYIELINDSEAPYNLSGCAFTSGITYTFGARTLAPQERIVVCRDRAKFTARYGTIANLADGTYTGRLSDEGEAIALASSAGVELFRFSYSPDGDWPSRANGLGSSLEVVDPSGNLSSPSNWRSSTEYAGSPGRAGVGPIRSVVINEVLAHTDPPLEDAVELHNTTAQAIDVGGWYLSSQRSNPTRYRIPSPWIIPANGYTVFYQYQFDSQAPAAGDDPFAFSSSQGDEAVLLSADANGSPIHWMDAVSFGPTQNGVSLGRYPNGSGSLVPMSALTLGSSVVAGESPDRITSFRAGTGASNAYPLVGPVVFNRIMYRPPTGGDEFIELLNSADFGMPLYDPQYPVNRWQVSGGIEYTFDAPILLDPGERILIVATNPAAFRAKYALPESLRIFGPFTNQLSNAGERIALLRPDAPQLPPHPDAGLVPYFLVEEVRYSPEAPWPATANGQGAALLRRDPKAFADDPSAWTVDTLSPVPNLTATGSGTSILLAWTAVTDQSLALEQTTNPFTGTWSQVTLLPAGTGQWSAPATETVRFYRLRRP